MYLYIYIHTKITHYYTNNNCVEKVDHYICRKILLFIYVELEYLFGNKTSQKLKVCNVNKGKKRYDIIGKK